ncbi:MAG: LacI family DNA-binding transcriptional regulator [Gemmatimonadota bacterium]|nr:LacI family DNA-binding transcriptional regulator [Gemmatimonadota bacterium]
MEKTGTLGLLTYQISLKTFGVMIDQIMREANKQNYQLLLRLASNRIPKNPTDDQIIQVRQLIFRGVDGLLIHTRGYEEESERILDAVRGRVPVVTFLSPTQNLSGVVLDLVADFYEATEHLIELGHERIGFIGPDGNETSLISAKAKGYLLAMRNYGLTHQFLSSRNIRTEGGYRDSKELGDQFTALVCRDDYTAMGVCRGLWESGIRIPDDVAVVGNGDIEVAAYLTPALTTLATPYEAIARAVMDLMLEQLEAQAEPRQVILKSRLVVRESCGANQSEK